MGIYETIDEYLKKNKTGIIATVITRAGSAPRDVGAKSCLYICETWRDVHSEGDSLTVWLDNISFDHGRRLVELGSRGGWWWGTTSEKEEAEELIVGYGIIETQIIFIILTLDWAWCLTLFRVIWIRDYKARGIARISHSEWIAWLCNLNLNIAL